MKSVSTLLLLDEASGNSLWFIEPIVESGKVFLVSRFFHIGDVLLERLSFGTSLRSMRTSLMKAILLLFLPLCLRPDGREEINSS